MPSVRYSSEMWGESNRRGIKRKRLNEGSTMNLFRSLFSTFNIWKQEASVAVNNDGGDEVPDNETRQVSTPRCDREKEKRRRLSEKTWFELEDRRKYEQLIYLATRSSKVNHVTTMTEPRIIETIEITDDNKSLTNQRPNEPPQPPLLDPTSTKPVASTSKYEPLAMPHSSSHYKEIMQQKHKLLSKEWFKKLQQDSLVVEDGLRLKKREKIEQQLQQMRESREATSKKLRETLVIPGVKLSYLSSFHLRITEDKKVEEFPPITPEMESVIVEALTISPRNEEEVLVNEVRRKDIQTLYGLNWLNDEIINEYFSLLERKREQCKCLSTFFFKKLTDSGFRGVKRWTKKFDLFSYKLILIPVHLTLHWTLIAVNLEENTITFYDSMSCRPSESSKSYLKLISTYLEEEHKDKKGGPFGRQMKLIHATGNPQQENSSDCGMFCCKYAEYLSRDKEFTFDQGRMNYFRRRMVYEIITQQLL